MFGKKTPDTHNQNNPNAYKNKKQTFLETVKNEKTRPNEKVTNKRFWQEASANIKANAR